MSEAENKASKSRRLPPWLKRRFKAGGNIDEVRALIKELGLETVCASAQCPNQAECFSKRTATFMILGDRCTRSCRFCAVTSQSPLPLREDEPESVAEACERLGLRHAVITSVTRDDLPDGGALQFRRVCHEIRKRMPDAVIEILTPDFGGDMHSLRIALDGRPDVFNHNVETVPRLYPAVRPEADYQQSLDVLAFAKKYSIDKTEGKMRTKSGLMVGLGETLEEIVKLLDDLRAAGCDMLTVGQYLAPSPSHHAVVDFIEPSVFEDIERLARERGFSAVASGPYVRSSYMAETVYRDAGLD